MSERTKIRAGLAQFLQSRLYTPLPYEAIAAKLTLLAQIGLIAAS